MSDVAEIYRDDSPPAYSADGSAPSHAASWFRTDIGSLGPYYSRHDAEMAAKVFGESRAADLAAAVRGAS